MPTVITKTVKGSGGDYTSLSAAIAGTAGNLVSLDQQVSIACYASATADQSIAAVNVAGYTTDATHYLKIYTPSTERHPGWWSGTFYYLNCWTNISNAVTLSNNYTVIDGLAVNTTDTCNAAVFVNAANCTVSNCLVESSEGQYCYRFTTAPSFAYNDIAISTDSAIGFCDTSVAVIDSCTAHTANYGGFSGGTLTNCLAVSDYGLGISSARTGSDYNASNGSGSSGGTHDRVSQTFTFVNKTGGNLQLASADTGAKGCTVCTTCNLT